MSDVSVILLLVAVVIALVIYLMIRSQGVHDYQQGYLHGWEDGSRHAISKMIMLADKAKEERDRKDPDAMSEDERTIEEQA